MASADFRVKNGLTVDGNATVVGTSLSLGTSTTALTTATVGGAITGNILKIAGTASGTSSITTDVTTGTVNIATGVTTGTVNIATGGASTTNIGGAASTVAVGTSGNSTLTVSGAATIKSPAVSGTDTTGNNLTIGSGLGTGAGTSGNLYFQTAPAGSTGTTVNTYASRLIIDYNGQIVIGPSLGSAGRTLTISKTITGATSSYGILNNGTVQSDVTTLAVNYYSTGITAASLFTLTDQKNFSANQGVYGTSSIVTNQYGFSAESTLIGATNNYGFYSNIAAPTSGGTASAVVFNIAQSGTTVTVYTVANHGFSTGQYVTIVPTAPATSLTSGALVTILSPGTTNFTLIGAANSTAGTSFTATGAGTGTGTVTFNSQGTVQITVISANGFTYTTGTSATFTTVSGASGAITVSSRYNLYMAGTANNYIASKLGIANTAPSALLTLGTAGTTAGTLSLAGSTSGTATINVSAAAGTPTLTLPTLTGTLVGTGDTGTVTNTMLAGSIANSKLTNSAITINSASTSLGSSVIIYAGTTALQTSSANQTLSGITSIDGGTSVSQALTIQSTTGIGTSDSIVFKVGNNGATTAMTINTSGNITVSGNLTVNGTTTTVNSSTMTVDDKNLELGVVVSATVSTTGTVGTITGALLQGSTTFTASGTSVTAAATYTGVSQSATSGSGSGAVFTIQKTGSGTEYSGFITVTITTAGTGYAIGNTITIPGASLGGTTPTNNLTLTVATALGSPWSATVTGMTATTGLVVGSVISATNGSPGSLGGSGTYIVASIDSATSITYTATGGTTPVAGSITNITTTGATDTTADGGGITLKGATDKTITWDSTNSNWTSNQDWNLASGKAFKINNTSVLNATTLGSGVTASSLTSVGTLVNLTVTNTITGSISGNAATATTAAACSGNAATATTATTATNSNNAAITSDSASTTAYVTFVTATSGNTAIRANTSMTYNASTNVLTTTATQARYADLAERYTADDNYEPGTVLDFGGANEVTISNTDMSRKIAGIVSTNPGYLMNAELESEFVVTLALTGRVPCKVQGAVRKGDMMVSASNGYARAEEDPKLGSVIGKALEDFNGITGVIEVVVGRL
jgi:hypothetical protein